VSRIDRTDRVLRALEKRISRQGDMPIRISLQTMEVLLRAVGLGMWDAGQDPFREVDALALDALRFLALQRRPTRSMIDSAKS
jgi:hypothetical protein